NALSVGELSFVILQELYSMNSSDQSFFPSLDDMGARGVVGDKWSMRILWACALGSAAVFKEKSLFSSCAKATHCPFLIFFSPGYRASFQLLEPLLPYVSYSGSTIFFYFYFSAFLRQFLHCSFHNAYVIGVVLACAAQPLNRNFCLPSDAPSRANSSPCSTPTAIPSACASPSPSIATPTIVLISLSTFQI
ncbi:hypothetical protein S83_047096, partial [Arachis hypogaea]